MVWKRNNREILKEQCLQYLGGKRCSVCGVNSLPICCYDFHHTNGLKEENISKLIGKNNKMTNKLKEELDKCKVVCANCHRQITAGIIKKGDLNVS